MVEKRYWLAFMTRRTDTVALQMKRKMPKKSVASCIASISARLPRSFLMESCMVSFHLKLKLPWLVALVGLPICWPQRVMAPDPQGYGTSTVLIMPLTGDSTPVGEGGGCQASLAMDMALSRSRRRGGGGPVPFAPGPSGPSGGRENKKKQKSVSNNGNNRGGPSPGA